jgi:leucyl aminopeptidase (aminopeptidase T)
LYYRYYKRDEASFTIIAFPSPEIGDKFPEIFSDTLKINLLDSDKYAQIQQKIIDVLDTAEYVHVKGKPGNDTDIMVKMHPLTILNINSVENCVALHNPSGEVDHLSAAKRTSGMLMLKI